MRPPAAVHTSRPEGDAAVAYDVQPTVVAVLVGALALLTVVAVVAVVALAPSSGTLAGGPVEPATSAARPVGEAAPAGPAGAGNGASGPPSSPGASPGSAPPGGGSTAGRPASAPLDGAGPAPVGPGGVSGVTAGGPVDASEAGRPAGAGGTASPAGGPSGTGSGPPPAMPVAPSTAAGSVSGAVATPSGAAAVVPVNLDAVAGQNTAVVRWAVDRPAVELGGFRVVWTGGGRTIDQQVGPEARKAQAEGLLPATGYSVAITPVDRDGRSDAAASQTIAVTTLPSSLPPPRAPANLSVSPGRGSLTVTWTADPADLATTQFYVSWSCCTTVLGGLSVDREVRSYTITGLASGVAHTVQVQALGPNLDADPATRRSVSGTPG